MAHAIWGVGLHPWQAHVADVALEQIPNGRGGWQYAHGVVVVVVPRRAGKTRLTQAVGLFRSSQPGAWVWATAQDGKNAAVKFRSELVPDISRSPVAPYVTPRTSQGSEGLTWEGGGHYKLFAPTPEQLHGFDGDMVIVDEAWAFNMERGQAIEAAARPIGLTRFGQFQLWIISAGGGDNSTWLDSWMTLGREGRDGVAYFEWSADADVDGFDPYDPDTITAAHPAVADGFIPVEAVLADRHTMDPDVFLRSYLNVWDRPSESVRNRLDAALWAESGAVDVTADSGDALTIAVDVSVDRQAAAVVAASRTGLDVAVEVIRHDPGTDWIVGELEALVAARPGAQLVMDSLAAATIVADLARGRVDVTTTGSLQMAQACQMAVDLLNGGRLTHRTHGGLDKAVQTATTRKLRDAWAWSRATSADDISPLVAASLAIWGAVTTEDLGRPILATS